MRSLAIAALTVAPMLGAQGSYGPTALQCARGACTGYGAPVGACVPASPLYTDLSVSPAVQYACVNFAWQPNVVVRNINGNSPDANGNITVNGGGGGGSTVTVAAGTATGTAAGTAPTVTNAGTSTNAVFNFTIPAGQNGTNGTNGTAGAPGTAATVSVGSTTTGPAGTQASVTNAGTSSAAILNFVIPQGQTGSGGGSGGSSSVGAAYSPQLASPTTAGAFIADPFVTYSASGTRDYQMYNGAIQTDHSTVGNLGTTWGRQIMSEFYGPSWNSGSYTNAAGTPVFATHNAEGLSIITASHSSGISGGLDITHQCYGHNGDCHGIYGYFNYMPGTVKGGSDEGYSMARLFANASSTPTATLASDATTTTVGSTQLRVATYACGGSSGSSYGSGSCLGAGGWVADKALALYATGGSGAGVSTTGLHMTAFSFMDTVNGGGGIIAATVSETLTPDVFVSSTTGFDPPAGAAVTLPYTNATGTVPSSGYACVSAVQENVSESATYTTSGSNITLTGVQFQHEAAGGNLRINVSKPCQIANFIQDEADNATGKTFYAVLGYYDAHTVLMTTSNGGARGSGTFGRNQSIVADGATGGQFQVFPGALVLDVTDPTYNATAQYYLYTPKYLHVGVNNTAWGAGHGIELGYDPSDTFYGMRLSFTDPLPDTGKGSDGMFITMGGSLTQTFHVRYQNNSGVGARRGYPNLYLLEAQGTGSGKIGNYFVGLAPTSGYFNSTVDCNNAQTQSGCPDAPLFSEPGLVNGIQINRAAHAFTFNASGGYNFNGGSMNATNLTLSGQATATYGVFTNSLSVPIFSSSVVVGASQTNSCVITNSCPIRYVSNATGSKPQQLSFGGDTNGNFAQWMQNSGDYTLLLGTSGMTSRYRVCVDNCLIGSGYAGAPNGSETMLLDGNLATFANPVKSLATSGGFIAPLYTPASSSAACTVGQFADDANYHYVCTAANTWKRVALAAF